MLTTRPSDQIIGLDKGQPVSVGKFCSRINGLAEALPDCDYFLNLCTDRFQFLLGFCAVIARGKTNLLSANSRIATLEKARAHATGTVGLLHDGSAPKGWQDKAMDLRNVAVEHAPDTPAQIAPEHVCILSFTSGSTGEPKPVVKTWHTIVESTLRNAPVYLPASDDLYRLIATVPAGHMYGLETTVFLPLLANAVAHPSQPLFPADLRHGLGQLAGPRIVVTTPLHARALVTGDAAYPPVARVLIATAPLEHSLATSVDQRFAAAVREIYGSTETGTLAWREPVQETHWHLIEGFERTLTPEGHTRISAPFLPAEVELPDLLQWIDARRFELYGRSSDIIKIAGKRGSLVELNQALTAIDGVVDGIIFEPAEDERNEQRLAALVVAPTLSREMILTQLRRHFDDVFLPRPLLHVDALPRGATGKLPRRDLLEFFQGQRRHE